MHAAHALAPHGRGARSAFSSPPLVEKIVPPDCEKEAPLACLINRSDIRETSTRRLGEGGGPGRRQYFAPPAVHVRHARSPRGTHAIPPTHPSIEQYNDYEATMVGADNDF